MICICIPILICKRSVTPSRHSQTTAALINPSIKGNGEKYVIKRLDSAYSVSKINHPFCPSRHHGYRSPSLGAKMMVQLFSEGFVEMASLTRWSRLTHPSTTASLRHSSSSPISQKFGTFSPTKLNKSVHCVRDRSMPAIHIIKMSCSAA